jgi:regulator of protease activity HflC (stomatin/prohibitin superfamily)
MKKIFGFVGAALLVLTLAGCGEMVEVPPASKGIVLGANGYTGEVISPSRFRLPFCPPFAACDKIVVVEAGDFGKTEEMEILMPKEQVQLTAEIRFTLGISNDNTKLLSIFDRITPQRLTSGNFGTNIDHIYTVYGEPIIRNVVRSTLSKYTIAEVIANQGDISEVLRADITRALAGTALEVKNLGLGRISPPPAILEAQNQALQRRVDIEKAEASAQVAIREAQAELEVQRARREADLLQAQTLREADEILADGVTPELIRYRELQVLEKMAENGSAVFFPVDMLGSLGLENRVMNTVPTK